MKGVPEVRVSEDVSLLQDCLPVKFQDVKFKDPELMQLNFHEKHSYFLNYFMICLPSIVKVIIELFVCQNIKNVYA